MIRRNSRCGEAQRRKLGAPMCCSQVKFFTGTSQNAGLKNALILSLQLERPIARDDSLGKGNGGGNNQFCLAKGMVVALGRDVQLIIHRHPKLNFTHRTSL